MTFKEYSHLTHTYTADSMCQGRAIGPNFWHPGTTYDFLLKNLKPNTQYYYSYGTEEVRYCCETTCKPTSITSCWKPLIITKNCLPSKTKRKIVIWRVLCNRWWHEAMFQLEYPSHLLDINKSSYFFILFKLCKLLLWIGLWLIPKILYQLCILVDSWCLQDMFWLFLSMLWNEME